MFTQNPVTGADERVIEASWGLGEAVVAGLRDPRPLPHRPLRRGARAHAGPEERSRSDRCREGGTVEEPVAPELVEQLCLDDAQLDEARARSPTAASRSTAAARDIEWAIADGTLYLLQCRAVTRAGL